VRIGGIADPVRVMRTGRFAYRADRSAAGAQTHASAHHGVPGLGILRNLEHRGDAGDQKVIAREDHGLDFKIELFAEIDEAAPVDALIASSSSGITMSVIQSACARPERTVIGHPVNPPHLMPLVEVVGGVNTAPDAIDTAIAFYASIGKRPIRLLKELPGHAVNRLQSALYREVVDLIDQGVLSVADADDAVCWGPGLALGRHGPEPAVASRRGRRAGSSTSWTT
jgi:3-hydroxyacyl-CoA dehydrogenase, NAD binding domain